MKRLQGGGNILIDMKNVLDESRINFHLKGSTKDEILKEIVDIFDESGVLSDKEQYLKDVYIRESEGPTGMINNLCIPHGKSDGVNTSCIAVCRSDKLIDWESIDNKPVNVFVMMAIKNEDKQDLVKVLSRVAMKLANDDIVKTLKTTEDKKVVMEIFSKE